LGNWLKIEVLVAICLIPLFTIPVFAQSSEKSFGMFITEYVSILILAFLFLFIPVLIVLHYVLKGRLRGKLLKNILKGMGLMFLGLIVVGVASTFFHSDFENLLAQKQRASEEFSARTQAAMKEKEQAYNEKYADEIKLGIDPKSLEGVEWGKIELKGDYKTLDELQQLKWGGKISQNEFCGGMLTLMNQDRDRYLSEYWIDSYYRDCGTYQP